MRISDWSSDVCSSDLAARVAARPRRGQQADDLVGIALQQRRPAQQAMLAVTRRDGPRRCPAPGKGSRSEEHTSELQSLMRTSYAVFCLKKKNNLHNIHV